MSVSCRSMNTSFSAQKKEKKQVQEQQHQHCSLRNLPPQPSQRTRGHQYRWQKEQPHSKHKLSHGRTESMQQLPKWNKVIYPWQTEHQTQHHTNPQSKQCARKSLLPQLQALPWTVYPSHPIFRKYSVEQGGEPNEEPCPSKR